MLQRFQEAAPEDHALRLRREVLAAIFGSLADDPWDPAALAAVVRLWHGFARSMATNPQETARATEALARWHGASPAMGEPIAAALERAPIDGVDDGLRRAVARWREHGESVADSRRRSLLPVKTAAR